MKTLIIAALFILSTQAIASRSQIITLPDGTTMVCYYYNGGRIVDCSAL